PAEATLLAMSYLTPATAAQIEEIVEGSRFLGYVAALARAEEAHALLQSAREQHPDATHHCWAYRFGDEMRFSDDGEPGGSAGRPMLEVLLKRDLDRCAAVVVRYFGGKKLGVGGLVRAYGGAVAKALDKAGTAEVLDRVGLQVRAPFADVDAVLRELEAMGATLSTDFDAEGLVAEVEVLVSERGALEERLAHLTRGAASVRALPEGG